MRDCAAHTPEIPNAWAPHYPTWRREFERFDIHQKTILVGHSCGAGFLVRWLSENREIRVGRVVLVAPWIDPEGEAGDFFHFEIDPDMASRTGGLAIFNSDNDGAVIQKSVEVLMKTVPHIFYRHFHNYGHFCASDLKSDALPELLETVIED